MSEAEQLLLARRLKADPCRMTSLNLSFNCSRRNVQLEIAEAIDCMTALQTLNLACNVACFVVLLWGVF